MDQAPPLAVADAPFLIELERPGPDSVLRPGESITGYGWVLTRHPVVSITLSLDETRLCQATTGMARADVARAHPTHPGRERAGFVFQATLPRTAPGPATLRLHVRTSHDTHAAEVRVTLGAEAECAARPPPAPIRLALDEARVDAGGILRARGWAVGLRPIESVSLRLGERELGLAQRLLYRDDLSRLLVDYQDAGSAGFQLDARVELAERAGTAPLLVTARDAEGRSESVSVTLALPGRGEARGLPPAAMLARLEEAAVSDQGILRARGWALSLAPLERISVFLDGLPLGLAETGLSREDVAAAHPDYPNSRAAGFLLRQDMPEGIGPDPTIRVVVSAAGGIRRELTAPLVVPAVIRRARATELVHFFLDSVSLTEDGLLAGDGWAVCPSGITRIGLMLGEHDAGEAEIGQDRPDVGNRFPSYPSARTAGFRFAARLPGRFEGEQILQITLRGAAGEEHSVLRPLAPAPAEQVARPRGLAAAGAEAIKSYLDTPAIQDGHAREPVRGFMALNGWAIARAGIAGVEVIVDGQSQGHAYFGIRREEVQAAFPDRDALLSGFAMLVPPQVLKPGRHDVQVVVRDKAGNLEETRFSVEAEPAAEGPGPWQLRAKIPQAEIDLHLAILDAAGTRPAWALLLPLRRAGAAELARARETLAALRHHAYPHWRLHVLVPPRADPAAIAALLLAGLEEFAPRVTVAPADPMLELAALVPEGGMLALLAPGDRLGEDALLELSVEAAVRARHDGEAPDFLYSDERRRDPGDGAVKPFLKPDWSPDLLLSTNYIGRLWAVTAAPPRRAGIRLGELTRHGEFDAVLRLTEQARRIAHVPKVLCARGAASLDTPARERRALLRAAARRGIAASVLPGCVAGTWRLRREAPPEGMVSIIMSTIAARGLVRITIESIRARTDWPRFEIIVLDNILPAEDAQSRFWKGWLREHADVVVEVREAFNWSRFNNLGAAHARGEFLLFLNDDIEILDADWLRCLVEHARRPEIGVVGPRLLYPDGRVQHAGVFLSREVGRHAFRFYPRDAPGPFGLALTQRNVISVTGACMLVRRAVYDEVGGFDEAHSVVNNDLDFALRLRRAGLLVVYTPHATMIHHEMASRAKLRDVYNSAHFDAAWKDLFLRGDPYFHPMLTSDYDDYLIEPEPLRQFQVGHPLIARAAVRRILAVKLDHIGDFIAAFPAFRRIKRHFPDAELCVLAARASLELAPMEPAIDRVIVFNFFHARSELGRLERDEAELLELRQTLEPWRFDIAIDLRRQADTRKVLRYTGARWLAGFDMDYAHPWLDVSVEFEGDIARAFKRAHVSDSLVHLVDTLARACETDRAGVTAAPPAAQARAAFASLPGVREMAEALFARPVVCVHTGAGAANKQWPAASFAGLIDLLVGALAVHVLIIGGPDEAAFAERVMADVRGPERVFSAIGKTTLRTLPLALLSCELYVGNDSGPKHMAASLGVPTIGIHSGSVDAGEWGPMGVSTLTLRRDMTCGPCYIAHAEDCPRALACLRGITVGEVFRACQRMLALRPAGPDAPAA